MGETAARPRPRVLVVDDEANLRASLGQILSTDYDVTVCAEAVEALRLITDGACFDAILCDLLMPRMTGADLYEALEVQAPSQAASMAFLTGGAFTARAREFLQRVSNPRLEKPFTVSELRAVLRTMTGV